jgi:hypothetical protein
MESWAGHYWWQRGRQHRDGGWRSGTLQRPASPSILSRLLPRLLSRLVLHTYHLISLTLFITWRQTALGTCELRTDLTMRSRRNLRTRQTVVCSCLWMSRI